MKKNGIEPDWLFIMKFIFILDDVPHNHTKMDFNIHSWNNMWLTALKKNI